MNETKMLSFEECCDAADFAYTPGQERFFNAARQGTIPADRAVEIPEVGEWPEWAKNVTLVWGKGNTWDSQTYITSIPRPTPSWTPANGDPCLFEDEGRTVAGFIHGGFLYARGLMIADWKKTKRPIPFDPARIGDAWVNL